MILQTMHSATLMVVTVVDWKYKKDLVLNVCVYVKSLIGLEMAIAMMRQIMLDVCLMVEIVAEQILILYFAMNAYAMNKQNICY